MPRKYKEARKINKLKAIEAAAKLGVSQPTLSAWEGERKSPTVENLENIADLYGVTTDYLLGRTSSKETEASVPIPHASLPIFHGKPVWSPEHGWLLVNAAEHTLLRFDGQTISMSNCKTLYGAPPLFSTPALPDMEPLTLSAIRQQREVWLEPISPDPELQTELRGWYQVKDRFVQNEYGVRFYLGTYGAKWLAFEKE